MAISNPLYEIVRIVKADGETEGGAPYEAKRIWGPAEWTAGAVRPTIQALGLDPNIVPPAISGYTRLANNVFVMPVKQVAPKLMSRLQVFSPNQRRIVESNKVTYVLERIEADTADVISKMLTDLSDIHDADASRRFTYEGVSIKFDTDALTKATAYVMQWQAGAGIPFEWRGKSIATTDDETGETTTGPETILIDTADKVQALAMAIGARIGASFTARTKVENEIKALGVADDREAIAAYKIGARFEEEILNALGE